VGSPHRADSAFPREATALILLACVGLGNALVDVGLYTLMAKSVPRASCHGIVDPLLRQWLCRIRRLALGLMIICPVHAEIGEQLLHPRTLRVQ
jgi:hypothetical protein